MKFGINILARESSSDLREIGQRIEHAGFESIFLPEHTHIPVNGDKHAGGSLTHQRMSRMPDPYIALTAVAAVTTTLKIGTGISLIAQHDPIAMAKRIATIDQISGGRFMLGVGAGWNRSEAANHGVSARNRWSVMRENVLAMKAIWHEPVASFHGQHVQFDEIESWPKPVQKPHPPVIVGGEGPGVIDRVKDYGDAWGPHPLPGIIERIGDLRQREREGNETSIPVSLFNIPHDTGLAQLAEDVGVERCVLYIYDDGPGTIEQQLEAHIAFIQPWVT
ncbi:MAG: LLM class F420-dependent oxidoreductase [Sphaerobacteraceae bacterium]|nr:MAG: LLM class F420-dependent oxidoreductase [Sphaerobacteraceae bacterium]